MELGARSGLASGFLSACFLAGCSAAYMSLMREEVVAQLKHRLEGLGVQVPPGAPWLYASLIAAVVLALLASVSIMSLLLGSLYAKVFGARDNKAKAAGLALVFFAALELLFNAPLPPSLRHVVYASASAVYGSVLYVAYVRGFDASRLVAGLDEVDLRVLAELSLEGLKLRELEGRVGVGRAVLLSSLSKLEGLELVELDLEKRYRLTELGRLAALRPLRPATRRARLA